MFAANPCRAHIYKCMHFYLCVRKHCSEWIVCLWRNRMWKLLTKAMHEPNLYSFRVTLDRQSWSTMDTQHQINTFIIICVRQLINQLIFYMVVTLLFGVDKGDMTVWSLLTAQWLNFATVYRLPCYMATCHTKNILMLLSCCRYRTQTPHQDD